MAIHWYAIHTYSGQEARIVQYIQDVINRGELTGMLVSVLMPTHDVIQVKNGKKIKTTKKFFPSYILVEMELNNETSHFIRDINGVTGFVGGTKTTPLREEEVRRILGQTEKSSRLIISETAFTIGEVVKIKEGPFKDFDGTVDEIHPEKGKIKVMVSVFGRLTPVEVDFAHIQSIS